MTELPRPLPERQPSPKPERVSLGQKFHPFHPDRTVIQPHVTDIDKGKNHPFVKMINTGDNRNYASSSIVLPLNGTDVSFNIIAALAPGDLALHFVPFSDPYNGYHANELDIKLGSKEAKIQKLNYLSEKNLQENPNEHYQTIMQHPLLFVIQSTAPLPHSIATSLRLSVYTNNAKGMSFQSRPSQTEYEDRGLIEFSSFYPLGFGPFAHRAEEVGSLDGTDILLPPNKDKLATMEARFHLVTDIDLALEEIRLQQKEM